MKRTMRAVAFARGKCLLVSSIRPLKNKLFTYEKNIRLFNDDRDHHRFD